MNPIFILLLANLLCILSLLLFFYKSWLDSIRPDLFYIFNIYENDLLTFKEHKIFIPLRGDKEQYKINWKLYDKKDFKPYINSKGVYTWNFKEGNLKPMRFFGSSNIDGKLLLEVKKQSLDDIWKSDSSMKDFIQTWGLIIIAIVILVLFMYLINRDQTTKMILLNLTGRM